MEPTGVGFVDEDRFDGDRVVGRSLGQHRFPEVKSAIPAAARDVESHVALAAVDKLAMVVEGAIHLQQTVPLAVYVHVGNHLRRSLQ